MADESRQVVLLRNQPNTIMLGAQVRIDSILDLAGTAFQDRAAAIDFKRLPLAGDDVVLIQYRLRGWITNVRVVIEYDGNSTVHGNFYGQYAELNDLEIAVLHEGKQRPGVYEIRWDGRDSTADRRILLAGTYTVRVIADTAVGTFAAATEIQIAPAHAWNYAINTRKTTVRKNPDGTKRSVVEVESAVKEATYALHAQQKLSDGTAFASELTTEKTARGAISEMRGAALTYFAAHSSPIGLVFDNKPDGSEASWLGLILLEGKNSPIGIDTVSLKELPDDAFRDVFLVVLGGCRAGNSVYSTQVTLLSFHRRTDPKSVSGVLDEPTRKAIDTYQRMVGLPRTGKINDALLSSLGVTTSEPHNSRKAVRLVQATLAILSDMLTPDLDQKGLPSGVWGATSQLALTTLQRKVGLAPTGVPDAATLDHLGLGADDRIQENVAQTLVDKGAEIVLAFSDYTEFEPMERWSSAFWGEAARGGSLREAMAAAKEALQEMAEAELKLRKSERTLHHSHEPSVFARVPKLALATRLVPARYGRGFSP